MFSRVSTALAIALVLFGYYFFMTAGTMRFPLPADVNHSHYASLAEGFRQGHLYLAAVPDEHLAALPDPYDPQARAGIPVLWDASYFKGRYYLYFSPLPALLLYMPWHAVTGRYPGDYFAACFFGAWAFLACVAFLITALRAARHTWMCVLLIGFANFTPYSLSSVRMYEITILAGAAMSATWAYATLRFFEDPRPRTAALMSLALALAIGARPNLGVLLPVLVFAILYRVRDRATRLQCAAAAMAPLILVAIVLLWYNVARFGAPFEFGHRYQLSGLSMEGRTTCRVANVAEVRRMFNGIVHYVFWPFSIVSRFPFIELHPPKLDPSISYPGTEPVLGVVFFTPIVLIAPFVARKVSTSARAAIAVMAGAWLVLLGLSTCWYVVARYELDFLYLMTAASAVIIESAGVRRMVVMILVVYSIALGLLLGLDGRDHEFQRLTPERFHVTATVADRQSTAPACPCP